MQFSFKAETTTTILFLIAPILLGLLIASMAPLLGR